MAITRLKRKTRTNRTKYSNRAAKVKFLNSKPVLKNVDMEKIKEEFAQARKAPAAKVKVEEKENVVEETPEVTTTSETKVKEPVAKKPVAKKPVAKKAETAKKPVAKKADAKKPAAGKTATKKADK